MMHDKNIVCDECKKSFLYEAIKIEECAVAVEGQTLLLDYFVCPFCNAVYRVLLVDEYKYKELLDDIMVVKSRIAKQQIKGNLEPMQKLQMLLDKKQQRIKSYVGSMNKKYNGRFIITENGVVYLP